MRNTRRLRRNIASALTIAAVGVTAAACSSSASSSSTTSTSTSASAQAGSGAIKKGLLVYFIPKDTQNPYEVIADTGGEKALAALGGCAASKPCSAIPTPIPASARGRIPRTAPGDPRVK